MKCVWALINYGRMGTPERNDSLFGEIIRHSVYGSKVWHYRQNVLFVGTEDLAFEATSFFGGGGGGLVWNPVHYYRGPNLPYLPATDDDGC
jgi:hypothetical protein